MILLFCAPAALKAQTKPPEEPIPAVLALPKQLFDAGKYSQVITALSSETMQKMSGYSLRRATLYLAESYQRTRQLDRALSVYQLGIKLFPRDVELLIGLAKLFHDSRLEEQARPLYNRILDLEPGNIPAHLGLAEIDRALGFLSRSADHYEVALEHLENNADVWREYAEVLYQQKEYKTAELAINKSLALSPQVIDSKLDLAFIERGAGRLDEALLTLEKILTLTGRQSDLTLTDALWLIEASRFEEAQAEAQEVLKGSPSNALAHWIYARASLPYGRREAAVRHLKEAVADSSEDSFIARASAKLLKAIQ